MQASAFPFRKSRTRINVKFHADIGMKVTDQTLHFAGVHRVSLSDRVAFRAGTDYGEWDLVWRHKKERQLENFRNDSKSAFGHKCYRLFYL
jgi:hypothetical protein